MSRRLRCAKVPLLGVDVYLDSVNRCPMERPWRCDDNSQSVRLMSWVGIGAMQAVIVDCRCMSGDDFHRSVIVRVRTLYLKASAFQRSSCAIDRSVMSRYGDHKFKYWLARVQTYGIPASSCCILYEILHVAKSRWIGHIKTLSLLREDPSVTK